MTSTLCVCGKFHTEEEFAVFEKERIMNQTEKKPSTTLDICLTCGCILRERFEYYKSSIPRNNKTLLRRVYGKEENQSPAITGKTFTNLIANEGCTKHWIEPKLIPEPMPMLWSDVRHAISEMSLTRNEAELLHRDIENRVNK